MKRTALYEKHIKANAKIVDFAGWEMPLHYGSQIKEHKCVRKNVGMFDVSHMGIVDVHGEDAYDFLRYLLANDIAKMQEPGKAIYSCMLNEYGGVVDDLIVYWMDYEKFRIILNAGTRKSDLKWLKTHSVERDLTITERPELSIIAVQGPGSLSVVPDVMEEYFTGLKTLKPFNFVSDSFRNIMVARTGYTGEAGFEIVVPNEQADELWDKFSEAGAKPCGLGSRDTLRLEAGYNLYGLDMDQYTSPLVSNLSWTVSFDDSRNFIGRQALEEEKEKGIKQKLVGLTMKTGGILRNHQKVFLPGVGEGEITSGGFSPTLGHAIALARVPVETVKDAEVERLGKRIPVEIVKPPFIKK